MQRPESALVTLADLIAMGVRFQVPIYQRLYVWGLDQVDTLLPDLWVAFQAKAEVFYLGGTLVVEREDARGPFLELIDGQQRFTSLWMMSLAWGGPLLPFAWIAERDLPRVGFSIRDDVDAFFRGLRGGRAPESHPSTTSTPPWSPRRRTSAPSSRRWIGHRPGTPSYVGSWSAWS
jgi:hypothetical protein